MVFSRPLSLTRTYPSTFCSFSGKQHCGPNNIFTSLSSIRATLVGECPPEKLVHVVEKLQCRAHGEDGVAPF